VLLEQGLAGLRRDVFFTFGGSEWSGYLSIVKRRSRCKGKRTACWLGLLVGKGGDGGDGEGQARMGKRFMLSGHGWWWARWKVRAERPADGSTAGTHNHNHSRLMMGSTVAAALARQPETEGRPLTVDGFWPRERAMTQQQQQCAIRRATSCERT
jgi:hypothetical protein